MDDHIAEVLVVHGVVTAEGSCIVVIDDRLVLMVGVISAEVVN